MAASPESDRKMRLGKCHFNFVAPENNANICRDFLGYRELDGIVRSEPEGWIFCGRYQKDGHADSIYNFDIRDDDVWILSYPKSGTTWTQHMLWLLLNPDDRNTRIRVDLRSPFIELDSLTPTKTFINTMMEKRDVELGKKFPDREFLDVIDSEIDYLRRTRIDDAEAIPKSQRRLIKSHNPLKLLPPDLLQRNKVVYVARDPRDVLISYYHHHKLIRHHEFVGSFKLFFEYFVNEQVLWSPYWHHLAQAWEMRDNPNLLFIFFSDMKENLPEVLQRVAAFLGCPLTPDEKVNLLNELSIDSMKKNEGTNDTDMMVRLGQFKSGEGEFVRRGKEGGWREYIGEGSEMMKTLEEWKDKNVRELRGRLPPLEKIWPK